MENSYGIGVRNRYELFYDDDIDPLDLIKQTQKAKEHKSSSEKENKTKGPQPNAAASKTAAVKAPLPTAAPNNNNKKGGEKGVKSDTVPKITDKTNPPATQTKGPRTNDGRVKFSDREERNNRRNRAEGEFRDAPPPRFEGEGRGAMSRGRGRGMGRGRGRGRGGPGGPDSRGKREYDRQSGMATTGVKSVDKREGSGSFNWGSDKDQIDEQLNAVPATNSDHDTSAENVEKTPEGETTTVEEGGEPPKEEENAKEMTLDEWKAMQGSRNKPQFNIRRAGEGENQAQWKKTYILKKKVEEDSDEEEEEEEEDEEVHHGRRKVILDIDFQFSDSPARGRGRGRGRGGPGRGRGGMDRGGRGGGGGDRGDRDRGERGGGDRGDRGGVGGGGRGERRGGGGRGERGGRGASRQEAPKMDDERDFPSLG